MTKDQEDTLNMFEATSDVLHVHEAVWNTTVPFTEAVTDLDDNIDAIGDLRDQQEADTTGVTDDKEQKRLTLEEKTYNIASAIVFYASVNNKRELLKKVNFTQTALSKARDNELPGMSSQVHQAATDNLAALAPYGIVIALVNALKLAIDEYVAYISKPRAAVSETSAATEQLPKVFTDTDTLLEERLDKGMELFKAVNLDFYTQYFNAREIINSPTLKRALDVRFVDDVTSAPVSHVKVNVDGTINRRTSELGNMRVQSLSEGGHSLTGSIPGYANVMQNFNVITGETTKIVVRLVKV